MSKKVGDVDETKMGFAWRMVTPIQSNALYSNCHQTYLDQSGYSSILRWNFETASSPTRVVGSEQALLLEQYRIGTHSSAIEPPSSLTVARV